MGDSHAMGRSQLAPRIALTESLEQCLAPSYILCSRLGSSSGNNPMTALDR